VIGACVAALSGGLRHQRHTGAGTADFKPEREAGHRAPGASRRPGRLSPPAHARRRLIHRPGRPHRTRTRSTPRRRSRAKPAMMKRRQSGRRRGARVISDMRRPLADDFVKCKRPARAHERRGIWLRFALRFLIAVRAMSAKILSEAELSDTDLWVFGYGSLMWRPGFAFIEQVPARLIGEHRAPLRLFVRPSRDAGKSPALCSGSTAAAPAAASHSGSRPNYAAAPWTICAAASRPPTSIAK